MCLLFRDDKDAMIHLWHSRCDPSASSPSPQSINHKLKQTWSLLLEINYSIVEKENLVIFFKGCDKILIYHICLLNSETKRRDQSFVAVLTWILNDFLLQQVNYNIRLFASYAVKEFQYYWEIFLIVFLN